jgi:hypothetical protein
LFFTTFTRTGARNYVAFLDSGDTADIDAHRGAELQRVRRWLFRIAEHDADLFADLVDEKSGRCAILAMPVSLSLRHQALNPMWPSPISPSALGTKAATSHYQDVNRIRCTSASDFERLFAVVGLRDQQVLDIHTQFLGILRISAFGVNECGHARSLCLGDHLQGDRRFARRFWPEDFNRVRAKPPTPNAASKEIAPVGITEIGVALFDPSRIIEPCQTFFQSGRARDQLLWYVRRP